MSRSTLRYEEVEPVGTRRATVHRNYGLTKSGKPDPRNGWYTEDLPAYPVDQREIGAGIREARKKLGLTLGDAARASGLSVVDVTALERGAARCDHEALIRLWAASRA